DADAALYNGFIQDGDKRLFADVRSSAPEQLGTRSFGFRDPRMPELLFRYRARNWPETLDTTERARWDEFRRRRLDDASGQSELGFTSNFRRIDTLRAEHAGDAARLALLEQLESWGRQLHASLA